MNTRRNLAVILTVISFGHAFAQSQDMDKELSDMATNLATLTKDNGKKKITVLDFTDLQGGSSELGKYIAEELTVDMVMVKRDFSVLDRANLRKILAEHKLTATGLVDPENAKKLGQFAGVDALILGTVIPKNQKISLTAKIITTDTAEIVGAAKAEFKADETVQQLMSRATTEDTGEPAKASKNRPVKSFGDLEVDWEHFSVLKDGRLLVNLVFRNKSSKTSIAVAMYAFPNIGPPYQLRSSLIGADGTECFTDNEEIMGIQAMRAMPRNLTEIPPGKEIKTSLKYKPNGRFSDNLTSLRLQAEIVINPNYKPSQYDNFRVEEDVLPPFCKIENLVFDITANK